MADTQEELGKAEHAWKSTGTELLTQVEAGLDGASRPDPSPQTYVVATGPLASGIARVLGEGSIEAFGECSATLRVSWEDECHAPITLRSDDFSWVAVYD